MTNSTFTRCESCHLIRRLLDLNKTILDDLPDIENIVETMVRIILKHSENVDLKGKALSCLCSISRVENTILLFNLTNIGMLNAFFMGLKIGQIATPHMISITLSKMLVT